MPPIRAAASEKRCRRSICRRRHTAFRIFAATLEGYFQNKSPSGILRAVGQPIACTVTEQLLDLAARKLNIDPAEIRRRNYVDAHEVAKRSAGGVCSVNCR